MCVAREPGTFPTAVSAGAPGFWTLTLPWLLWPSASGPTDKKNSRIPFSTVTLEFQINNSIFLFLEKDEVLMFEEMILSICSLKVELNDTLKQNILLIGLFHVRVTHPC